MNAKKSNRGFALPMVVAIVVVLMILLPALVSWVQRDSQQNVRNANRTVAFNLSEGAVERGMWKLKSSTSTFAQALAGTVIADYNFDKTFVDVDGGTYRIRFSSGPAANEVTVYGEGKDKRGRDIRAVKAVYKNQTIPGALISGGVITWANAFSAQWGPIMAWNNINITDANAAKDYFPRKFSRQVVQTSIGSYERDINGLNPPNTDNQEWWSDYPVPELPILDFTALRSSAAATNTLNIFGCSKTLAKGWNGAAWPSVCTGGGLHAGHFQNSYYHPLARKQYVWYWDGDVSWTGSTGDKGHAFWGTFIIRGNLTNTAGDNYTYAGPVPTDAWQEYSKITSKAGDTTALNEYPADNGYQKNRDTFNFGSESWSGGPNPVGNTDIGIRGFLYVGGNFDIQGPADINGAVYVVGNVSKAVGSERTVVFFDDSLNLPTLNVVLVRRSWDEVSPSTITWQ